MVHASKRQRALLNKLTTQTWVFTFALLSVLFVLISTHDCVRRPRESQGQVRGPPPSSCLENPTLLILVLTSTRHLSLKRLLESLSSTEFGCARVDLQINIDISASLNTTTFQANQRCTEVALQQKWTHGSKSIFRRLRHAGLSHSWFEGAYTTDHEYLSILEDDMQVSRHFYTIFSLLHKNNVFSSSAVTAFCLHPNDWEVKVEPICTRSDYSKHLYLSPEPCNWGPIWKSEEWRKYLDWVFVTKSQQKLPYVQDEIAYEFNTYIRVGKDVQSSWVWRYNYDFNKLQIRYSFSKCTGKKGKEKYLAINHKEPGEHFKKKLDFHNDPRLLEFSIRKAIRDILSGGKTEPMPFPGYAVNAKSLRG